MEFIVIAIVAFVLWKLVAFMANRYLDGKRRQQLTAKYNDAEVVDLIMSRSYWQGQTSEQLVESIGSPVDIDKKVLKSKTKETWKYHQVRKGQFGLRVMLEDNVVVGWEQKA